MPLQIRSATTDDAGPACTVLHASITHCCVDDHHGDPATLAAWLRNKTPEQVRAWILSPDHHAIAAIADGLQVGFALSSRAGEVLLCYLLPQARFSGVGKAMLAAIEERARADGVHALRLDSTATARPFYLRNGFVEKGRPTVVFGMQSHPMEKALTSVRTDDAVSIALVPASQADFEALAAIRVEAMRESLERLGRFDPVRAWERLRSGFAPEHTRHIEIRGERVGFVVVKPHADHLLLDHLYIRPGHQGAGIGSQVLRLALAQAAALGLAVKVCALKHSDANRFYQRHGFALIAQEDFDNHYLRQADALAPTPPRSPTP